MSFQYTQLADEPIQKKDLGIVLTKQMIVFFVIHLVFSCSHSMISQNLKEGFLFKSISSHLN